MRPPSPPLSAPGERLRRARPLHEAPGAGGCAGQAARALGSGRAAGPAAGARAASAHPVSVLQAGVLTEETPETSAPAPSNFRVTRGSLWDLYLHLEDLVGFLEVNPTQCAFSQDYIPGVSNSRGSSSFCYRKLKMALQLC